MRFDKQRRRNFPQIQQKNKPLLIGGRRGSELQAIRTLMETESEYSGSRGSIWKIPEDLLLVHIFMILPATTVLAVRGVCKPWRRLTTTPSFVRAHTRRHCDDVTAATKSLIVQFNPSPFSQLCRIDVDTNTNQMCERSIEIQMPPNCKPGATIRYYMTGSCDGLLCFDAFRPISYYVCNPVTKTVIAVQASSPGRPNRFPILKGIYFHRPTGEYRLLQYFHRGEDYKPSKTFVVGYEVATVKGPGSWRTVHELLCIHGTSGIRNQATELDSALAVDDLKISSPMNYGAVMSKGNFHWIPGNLSQVGIVAFDTDTEKFKKIATPSRCMQLLRDDNIILNEIGGNLCIGLSNTLDAQELMDIWLMKDYQLQQWTRLHRVASRQRCFETIPKGEEEMIEEIKMLMRWDSDKQLSLYDFKLNTSFHLHVSQLEPMSSTLHYTESLVKL